MDILQREIADHRVSRLQNVQRGTPNGLGSWGAPAGLGFSDTGRVAVSPSLFSAEEPKAPDIRVGTRPASREQNGAAKSKNSPQPATGRFRERELEWRRTHQETLRHFENEWIVLEGEEIIAHNSDLGDAIREARSRGIRTPYVFFVEPQIENFVQIGL